MVRPTVSEEAMTRVSAARDVQGHGGQLHAAVQADDAAGLEDAPRPCRTWCSRRGGDDLVAAAGALDQAEADQDAGHHVIGAVEGLGDELGLAHLDRDVVRGHLELQPVHLQGAHRELDVAAGDELAGALAR